MIIVRMPAKKSLEDRFWSKVDVRGPSDCWIWQASLNRGYGQIGSGGKWGRPLVAHRVAWELLKGPLPDGVVLDHMCHDAASCPVGLTCPHRRCCNPAHLRITTIGDNVSRSLSARTTCKHGHPWTPENTYFNAKGTLCCRVCSINWQRAKREAAGAGIANGLKTQCKRGHPFDEQNTYYRPDGRRECVTCNRERSAARYRAGLAYVRIADR